MATMATAAKKADMAKMALWGPEEGSWAVS